jgi:FtsH-binding integral membrane protein
VSPSLRRAALFAAGVLAATLAADVAWIVASGVFPRNVSELVQHAKFLAVWVLLVILGGAIGFAARAAPPLRASRLALLGAIAAPLAYLVGVALQDALGMTGSLIAIVVTAGAVAAAGGKRTVR